MAISQFEGYIKENNIDVEIIVTHSPTHTAQDAADVHGVPVSNIVKSLLVKVKDTFELYLTPGDRRLDIPDGAEMANADEVKSVTGYSIGGVPPFGHTQKIKTFVEDGFDKNSDIVAAAGSANAVFRTTLAQLTEIVS